MRKAIIRIIDSILLTWTRRELLVLAILLAVLVIAQGARAQYFINDPYETDEWHGQGQRYFWANDQSCGNKIRPILKQAMNMWSFYAPPKLFEIENKTEIAETDGDGKEVVWCESIDSMRDNYGEGENDIAGATQNYGWEDLKLIAESDIAIGNDYIKPCTMLHELGHGLGIAVDNHHPADPIAVMYAYILNPGKQGDGRVREDCNQPFLTATDLVLAAKSYGEPANCTPYIQKDLSVYFPYIKGYEAEAVFKPLEGFWEVLWYAPAPKANWACNLSARPSGYAKGVWLITTDLYDPAICIHANKCPTRRKSFSLERGRLKEI